MSANIPTPVDVPAVDPSLDVVALEAGVNKEVIDAVASGPDDQTRKDLLFGVSELPEGAKEKIQTAGSGVLGAMLGVETYLASKKAGGNTVETTTATGPDDRVRLMNAIKNPNTGVWVDAKGHPLTEAEVIQRGLAEADLIRGLKYDKIGISPRVKLDGVQLTPAELAKMKEAVLKAGADLDAMQTDIDLSRVPEPKPTNQAQ